MSKYVQHDGARWRVLGPVSVDGEPGHELVRRVPGRPPQVIVARETDCQPDQHEPVRVLRDEHAVLRYNVKRGIVSVSEPGRRVRFTTTLLGILQMCARAEAARKALERAHNKRLGRRRGKV